MSEFANILRRAIRNHNGCTLLGHRYITSFFIADFSYMSLYIKYNRKLHASVQRLRFNLNAF